MARPARRSPVRTDPFIRGSNLDTVGDSYRAIVSLSECKSQGGSSCAPGGSWKTLYKKKAFSDVTSRISKPGSVSKFI